MTLLRAYTLVTGGVILLSTSAYATASGESALGVFALPTLAVLWWLSSRVGRRLLLPRSAVNLLLIAALAYGGWRMFGTGVDITSIAQVVVLLLAIKLTDRRSHRDDAQVILLAVFLAVAAILDSNKLSVGVQLLVLLPTLIASIMLYQLHPAYWPGLERASAAPPPDAAPKRRSPARAIATATAWATPAMLGAAWLIFLIIPRGMGENAFGQWGRPQGSTVTGFTDRVSLGRRNIISESPEIVFDARIEEIRPNGQADSIGAIDRVFYLRGAVLDVYAGGQWTSAQGFGSGVIDNRLTNHRHELRRPVRQRVQIRQTITLRDPVPRNQTLPLFHLFPPIAVQADRVGWILIEPSTMILSFRGDGGQLQYAVWSHTVDEREAPPPHRARPIPPGARLVELASSIVAEAGISPDPDVRPFEDDARAIQSIMDWLRTGFKYSLEEPAVPEGVDPIDHFLFTTRTGHCEYFASAMVFLCRAIALLLAGLSHALRRGHRREPLSERPEDHLGL
ncbi:DUF3488 and transglutaminase-like domain-containing protein [Leptolyngbya sp. 15MV]|nr:DUF3488 and transglutaminase-like domain-containing protein [Leptolyngbya sp. 15MV]